MTTPGGPSAVEQVSCGVGDDTVAITLSPVSTIDATSLARPGVCFVNKTQPGNLSYVAGINWIAMPEHKATADQVAKALHVAVRTFRC